jgi:Na+/H+-dicarboxylate symporter
MFRVLIRVIAGAVIVAIVLFVAAGTVAWQRAWVLLAVLLVVRTLSAIAVFRVNPALLRQRATVLIDRHQRWADRPVLLAFISESGVNYLGVDRRRQYTAAVSDLQHGMR